MTITYSEKVRNAGLDARITAIGPSPSLHIRDKSGMPLVTIVLPKVWMSKAANGAVQKSGEWHAAAHRSGEATSFCIGNEEGDHINGSIPDDMTLDNPRFERGQVVIVGKFLISAGNAAASA